MKRISFAFFFLLLNAGLTFAQNMGDNVAPAEDIDELSCDDRCCPVCPPGPPGRPGDQGPPFAAAYTSRYLPSVPTPGGIPVPPGGTVDFPILAAGPEFGIVYNFVPMAPTNFFELSLPGVYLITLGMFLVPQFEPALIVPSFTIFQNATSLAANGGELRAPQSGWYTTTILVQVTSMANNEISVVNTTTPPASIGLGALGTPAIAAEISIVRIAN